MAIAVTSCRTKEGEPGPAGESLLSKQGAISGTISYLDINGKPLTESFSYEYFETLSDTYYTSDNENYSIRFSRRDLKDYQKTCEFTLDGSLDQSGNLTVPEGGGLKFYYLSVANNNLFSFSIYGGSGGFLYFSGESQTTGVISNFSFNKTTGRLIFDYTLSVHPNDINYSDRYNNTTFAEINGHVDIVVLDKKEMEMAF